MPLQIYTYYKYGTSVNTHFITSILTCRCSSGHICILTKYAYVWQKWSLKLHAMSITGSADFSTKKEVFDRVMGVWRLQEEKKILVKEMKQHWESLKAHARVLSELSHHQSEDTMQSKCSLVLEFFYSGMWFFWVFPEIRIFLTENATLVNHANPLFFHQ